MGNYKLVVVTGAGGFIGGNLISTLRTQGYKWIRAVDVKPLKEWYQRFDDVENLSLDLNLGENCEIDIQGCLRRISPQIWEGWVSSGATKRSVCFLC
jgi:NADP-dependent 3-hydroxy acid dehydrogenase YdfG